MALDTICDATQERQDAIQGAYLGVVESRFRNNAIQDSD